MRKRKVTYPVAKTANRPARTVGIGGDAPYTRATVATIDLTALEGRGNLAIGDRVRIGGSGLYAGEAAIVESLVTGIIPSAVVRTEAGRSRRVRTIDLQPIPNEG